jgi:putative addiction module component (TIGR02574 family)
MNMPSRRCLWADERLQLIEELWESLDQDDIPLTEEQRAELDAGSPSTKQTPTKASLGKKLKPDCSSSPSEAGSIRVGVA